MQETRSINPQLICGIDEAGRGPLAGPVTAAAVILPPDFPVGDLRDSKKLSHQRREKLETIIRTHAHAFGLGWAWPEEIDSINILQATMRAMQRAVAALQPPGSAAAAAPVHNPVQPQLILVDGNRCPEFPVPVRAEIKGDDRIPEIMAASILAKTARDRWMMEHDAVYPGYGFAVHKGYPTSAHREAILRLGPSPIHRRSFRGAGVLSS